MAYPPSRDHVGFRFDYDPPAGSFKRSREFVVTIRKNGTIDWTVKEPVSAKLCVIVKRLLRKYGYPPDKQEAITNMVTQQAELPADFWMGHGGALS